MTIDPDVLAALERAEYELRDCSGSVSDSASRTAMLQAADFVSATIRKYTAASWRKLLADQANRIAELEAEVRAQSAVIDNLEAELRRVRPSPVTHVTPEPMRLRNGKVTRREAK
jgi:hypothetical protein